MATYRFSMTPLKRRDGRSAVAAAAYRSGERLVDPREMREHDYRRRSGVDFSDVVVPTGARETSRAELWADIELHHKRKDAVPARELQLSLPHELDDEGRRKLTRAFVQEMVDRYGVAADVAIHRPGKDGDNRNHHAHVLFTSVAYGEDGSLGKKVVEFDPIAAQRAGTPNAADEWRPVWQDRVNEALEAAGRKERVDHRSLREQWTTAHPDMPAAMIPEPQPKLGRSGGSLRMAQRQRVDTPALRAFLQTDDVNFRRKQLRQAWMEARQQIVGVYEQAKEAARRVAQAMAPRPAIAGAPSSADPFRDVSIGGSGKAEKPAHQASSKAERVIPKDAFFEDAAEVAAEARRKAEEKRLAESAREVAERQRQGFYDAPAPAQRGPRQR